VFGGTVFGGAWFEPLRQFMEQTGPFAHRVHMVSIHMMV
jgi:hypothetical protein